MKKVVRAVSGAAAGLMALSLVACGSTDSTTVPPRQGGATSASASTTAATATKEGATTIEFWTEDRHDQEYVQKMVDEFNASHDDIQINMTVVTDNYSNMLSLAYNGGTAPDLVLNNTLPLNQFADTGMFVPLNSYIDSDEEFQKVLEPYSHSYEGSNAKDGNMYAVYTAVRSGVRVEYNKDLLAKSGYTEIPDNLDDYIAMANKITEDGNGSYYGIGFTSSSPFERLLEMCAEISGIYYYDYVNGKYDFSGYKEIIEKGKQLVKAAYPDQQGVDNMRALFAQGAFALWSNASQEAGVFTSQLPISDFEWGVAPVPSLTGEIKGALQVLPLKGYSIMSSSKHQDEAWEVIKYFSSEEFLKGYYEGGYALPISDYMKDKYDSSKAGRIADFALLDYESVYPTPPAVNLEGDNYRTVLWNAVMGYVDADEAIEDLNTRYNNALDSDVASGTTKRLIISDYDPLHPADGTATYETK